MVPGTRRTAPDSGRARLAALLAVLILAAAAVSIALVAWYPTTQQPEVSLADVSVVTTQCAPILTGGYGNTYAWTFTLVNTGSAAGDVWVGFTLDGLGEGYLPFLVGAGSTIPGEGMSVGPISSSPGGCGALQVPGIAIASVTRSPPLDVRDTIVATVGPLATLGFVGGMWLAIALLARRRGFSIFRDLGDEGWPAAFLTFFAASMLSAVVTGILITPYNYPPDWTLVLVEGGIYGVVGLALFVLACRAILRIGRRNQHPFS